MNLLITNRRLTLHDRYEIPCFSEAKEDNTHFSLIGATEIAKIVINLIKLLENPLLERLQKAIK